MTTEFKREKARALRTYAAERWAENDANPSEKSFKSAAKASRAAHHAETEATKAEQDDNEDNESVACKFATAGIEIA